MSRLSKYAAAAAAMLMMTSAGPARSGDAPADLSQEQLYSLAADAYLYAYPIVTMDLSMRQAVNVPDAHSVYLRAPVNRFAHAREFPKADDKDVVRYNFDTLYSLAWLDLSEEPVILSVPDTKGRYYLLPMLDMWTDVFAVVGSRTTGTNAGHFAVVPPGWTGTLPEGVDRIAAPTPNVWIVGRTKTDGPSDYANVHAIQDGYRLTPLSRWGRENAGADTPAAAVDPSIDGKTIPLAQVEALSGTQMLERLASLLAKHPPHPNDYPILYRLRHLGIAPGKPFNAAKLPAETLATIDRAATETLGSLQDLFLKSANLVNGWNMQLSGLGTYGTNYLQRTFVAKGGLGANVPEDAVYPTASFGSDGKVLSGENRYVLRFEKGQLPPTDAFWSITMYDKDGFQVPNAIDRFALGSYDKLLAEPDGAVEIHVQAQSPGKDREANWLPAPAGIFQPTLRIYSPRKDVLNGTWAPPPFRKVD